MTRLSVSLPGRSKLIIAKQAAARKMAAAVGWFADPIFLGKESALMREMLGDRLPRFSQDEWELLRDSSDFYGCNTCEYLVSRIRVAR